MMSLYTQKDLILQAYRLLEDITPLSIDCGTLCGHACCKGDDHTGMWLFPGEEEMFRDDPDFQILSCEDNAGYPMVVCKGSCNREKRPLACRIFPLFPLVRLTEQGGITIEAAADPRARMICPLAGEKMTNLLFRRRVRQAAAVLMGDHQLREYLLETSNFLEELKLFQEKMTGIRG